MIEALKASGLRSFVNVPLLADDDLIGVLNVSSADEAAFDQEAIEIAQQVASTLAIAIRQAQLRERVERHANELEDLVAARTADLERSENRLSAILNALPDLVFVVDHEGRYLEILTSKEDLLYRPTRK